MRAHGAASAAGLRSAMKLRLYGYTGGCKFSSCCRSTQPPPQEMVITPEASTSTFTWGIYRAGASLEEEGGLLVAHHPRRARVAHQAAQRQHVVLAVERHHRRAPPVSDWNTETRRGLDGVEGLDIYSSIDVDLTNCLSVHLSVCLSIDLFSSLSIYMYIYIEIDR